MLVYTDVPIKKAIKNGGDGKMLTIISLWEYVMQLEFIVTFLDETEAIKLEHFTHWKYSLMLDKCLTR